eukprot:jgi/Psemu1/18844/gm1.18844_g
MDRLECKQLKPIPIPPIDCKKYFSSDGAVYILYFSGKARLEVLLNFERETRECKQLKPIPIPPIDCKKYFSSDGAVYILYFSGKARLEVLLNFERETRECKQLKPIPIPPIDCKKYFSSDGAVYILYFSGKARLEQLKPIPIPPIDCKKYFSSDGAVYILYFSGKARLEVLSNFERETRECKQPKNESYSTSQQQSTKMPFKKKRASGNTVPPRKREKKSTLLVRQQREAKKNDAADLGGTAGVNPTGGAAESTGRPSPRSIPQVNYAEKSSDDEEEIDPETYKEPPLPVATSQKHVRISIAVIFERLLGSPSQENWHRLKTIAQICDRLGNTTRSFRRTVSQVCTEVLHCVENGTAYTGDGNYSKSGRPPVIAVDTIEAEIIADSIEGGNSIRMTRLIVNHYRRKFQLPALTYWSVRSCMLRLSPQIKAIKRGKQGSKNKTNAWCRASFRWFAQLLLRFGEIDFSHPIFQKLLGPAYVKEKPPPCYGTSVLTPLKLSQVVWFDELHKGMSYWRVSFKRNANGKLDPYGKYPEKGKTVLQVKYERQARFNFGVYMSEDGKGHQVQPPFEYTGKKLITRVERNKLRLQAIGFCIPKLKSKTFEKLQQHNLCLVHDLKALSGNTSEIRTIAASVSGISFERLSAFVRAAEACLEGSPPPVVDHRLASNPYLSLYGEDSWEQQCDKDCMTGKMCVTEMIDFMFDQTKAIMGENGFVYHDALVLMTSADSVSYTKEKGYYKSWILPELDLMEECGGANPLDTSLFSQLNRAVDQHVILTQDFTDEDKKFSLATPGAISSAYNQIWTLHPKSETIVEDIKKVLQSFLQVVEAEGVAIDGVGDWSGRRYIQKDQHGGKRVRKLKDDCYDEERIELHKDAEDAAKCIVEKAEAKFKITSASLMDD